MYNKAMCEL